MYVINVTDAEFLTDFVGQGVCIDDRYSEHFWDIRASSSRKNGNNLHKN